MFSNSKGGDVLRPTISNETQLRPQKTQIYRSSCLGCLLEVTIAIWLRQQLGRKHEPTMNQPTMNVTHVHQALADIFDLCFCKIENTNEKRALRVHSCLAHVFGKKFMYV